MATAKRKSKATPKKASVKKVLKKKSFATKATAKKKVAAKTKAAPKKKALAKAPAKKASAKKKAPRKAISKRRVNEGAKNKARAKVFAGKLEKRRPTRKDSAKAFVDETTGASNDAFATEMAKDFLTAAETGKEVLEELSDEEEPEEQGGPFVESSANKEFADGTDESNPEDALREPFPTANRG